MDKLKELITEKMGEVNEQVTSLKSQIEALEDSNESKAKELKELKEAHETRLEGLKSSLDSIETENNRIGGSNKSVSFKEVLNDAITKSDSLDSYKSGNATKASISLKADMTSGTAYTGEVAEIQRVPGYYFNPDRDLHARDLLPVGQTSQAGVRFVQETNFIDNTGVQTEGSAKGQSEVRHEAKLASVGTVATYFTLSKQMIDDTPALVGYLAGRGEKKLRLAEDEEVFYGTGDIEGLTVNAKAYSTGSFEVGDPNKVDILVNAIKQVDADEYTATNAVINNQDFHDILTLKATDNSYLFLPQLFGGQPFNIAGTAVTPSSIIKTDEFLVGDYQMGAQIFDRQDVTLEFSDSDGDNFKKNMVTARIESRLALANYRPDAFVYGTFSTAITAATPA